MATNAWEAGLCLMCKCPLIDLTDPTHLCTECREKVKKMQYDLMHKKKPQPQKGHRKVINFVHKPNA